MVCFGSPASMVTVFVLYPFRLTTSVATSPPAKCSATGASPSSLPSRASVASDGTTLTSTSRCAITAAAGAGRGGGAGAGGGVAAGAAVGLAVAAATTVAEGSACAVPPELLAKTTTPTTPTTVATAPITRKT